MGANLDLRLDPGCVPLETLQRLRTVLRGGVEPALVECDGERALLPSQLREALEFALTTLESSQAVRMLPEGETLTTHQAARLLGVSRPHLLKLLSAGRIPYHWVGTHRRLLCKDVVSYLGEVGDDR